MHYVCYIENINAFSCICIVVVVVVIIKVLATFHPPYVKYCLVLAAAFTVVRMLSHLQLLF